MTLICAPCGRVFGLKPGKRGLSHGIGPCCYVQARKEAGLGQKPYPYPEEGK